VYELLEKTESKANGKKPEYFCVSPQKIQEHPNYRQLTDRGVDVKFLFSNLKGQEIYLIGRIKKLKNSVSRVLLLEMCVDFAPCSPGILAAYACCVRDNEGSESVFLNYHSDKVLDLVASFKDHEAIAPLISSLVKMYRSKRNHAALRKLIQILKSLAPGHSFSATSLSAIAQDLNEPELTMAVLPLISIQASMDDQTAICFGKSARSISHKGFMKEAVLHLKKFAKEKLVCATLLGAIAHDLGDRVLVELSIRILEGHTMDRAALTTYGLLVRYVKDKPKMRNCMVRIEQYIYSDRSSATVYALLSKECADKSIQKKAIRAIESFESDGNVNVSLVNTLAILYNNNGRMADARTLLRKYEGLFSGCREAFDHTMAVSYLWEGQYEQVIQILTDVKGDHLYPDDMHRMHTLQAAQRAIDGKHVEHTVDLDVEEPILLD